MLSPSMMKPKCSPFPRAELSDLSHHKCCEVLFLAESRQNALLSTITAREAGILNIIFLLHSATLEDLETQNEVWIHTETVPLRVILSFIP